MTGIRGIAALWVMLYHAQQGAGTTFNLPLLAKVPDLRSGWHGVDLFFMLSGFILMYAHARDFIVIQKENTLRFARLRFARVYPLNAVVLSLIAILVAFQPGFVAWARTSEPSDYSWQAFARTLFLANRWFLPGRGDWNQPVWSLSLEVLGYLMFPLLAFCALRITRKWLLFGVALLSLFGSLAILAIRGVAFDNSIGRVAFVRMITCFVTGIAIFRLWTLMAESHRKWAGWFAAVSVAGILILGIVPLYGDLLYNFFFASLLYGLAFQQGIVNRLLASRAAVFLGEISFPLYLSHVVPLLWLRYFLLSNPAKYSTIEKSLALVGWAVGCILMATLLHRYVEEPFHALGRRWAGARMTE
jgi:peptidoglycan/LPS O-acetylase OafA/YrhL